MNDCNGFCYCPKEMLQQDLDICMVSPDGDPWFENIPPDGNVSIYKDIKHPPNTLMVFVIFFT